MPVIQRALSIPRTNSPFHFLPPQLLSGSLAAGLLRPARGRTDATTREVAFGDRGIVPVAMVQSAAERHGEPEHLVWQLLQLIAFFTWSHRMRCYEICVKYNQRLIVWKQPLEIIKSHQPLILCIKPGCCIVCFQTPAAPCLSTKH